MVAPPPAHEQPAATPAELVGPLVAQAAPRHASCSDPGCGTGARAARTAEGLRHGGDPGAQRSARIGDVVRYAWTDAATAQVVVVDDSSIDDTAALAREAGAEVVTSSMLGKGASMRDGVLAASQGLVVYLDGDLSGLRPGIVSDLCRPLMADEADFVKARFGRGGGRVTELTARPMLQVFFPELARFAQPLGGLVAARVSLLKALGFEDGYGVDVGLLIDAHRAGARLVEVDIGSLEHDSQPLLDLTAMANEVSRVIYARAREAGRLHVEQIAAMFETQRQATASFEYMLLRRRGRTGLVLLDMDGTLTPQRYVCELARATDQEAALAGCWTTCRTMRPHAATASQHSSSSCTSRQFERVAQAMPLRPGVIEWVNRMRRAGFMVGVVSDSYFIAADILRRRIFADFALAHTLQFNADTCTGEVRLNPAFMPLRPSPGAPPDKGHVVRRFRRDAAHTPWQTIWAVGDHVNDLDMLREADRAFVIEPKSPLLTQVPRVTTVASFDELCAHVPESTTA
jgi:glucosyl-3-phosphoglycerate synthase